MVSAHQSPYLISETTTGGVRPRLLREATLQAVRNPGILTLARDLESLDSWGRIGA